MKSFVSDACTVAGILALSGGLYLAKPWIGIAVFGVLLIAFGFLLDVSSGHELKQ